jgi:IS5 family transposase
MAQKRTGQLSWVEALQPAALAGSGRLDRLSELVKWYRFEKLLCGLRHDGPGRAGYPALLMYKALLLQALYGLSDAELGSAERPSVVPALCGSEPGGRDAGPLDAVPVPPAPDRGGRSGQAVRRARPSAGEGGRDPQAGHHAGRHADRDRRKAGSTYGYKAHVGVDEGSGLIRAVLTTPANVNDTEPADLLIRGDEAAVWADAAYHTHARERRLKECGIKPRLARRANKHHPELSPRLKRYNRLIARRRAAVETTFATWKRRMDFTAIRYRGLAKAAAQVLLVAMAFNMRRWVTLSTA